MTILCMSVRINLCDDMETCQCKSDNYMNNGVCVKVLQLVDSSLMTINIKSSISLEGRVIIEVHLNALIPISIVLSIFQGNAKCLSELKKLAHMQHEQQHEQFPILLATELHQHLFFRLRKQLLIPMCFPGRQSALQNTIVLCWCCEKSVAVWQDFKMM
ncbi:hypothetical protein BDR06DRAFT_975457 [Suillus hirtellus]|nr:hypothetical protein BDR06DRAFT_975457 [Suillus hirtellus]